MKQKFERVMPLNIDWLSGLLEGEGCFQWTKITPLIRLGMTDKDIVQRAANMMGCNLQGPYKGCGGKGTKSTYKPMYSCCLSGKPAFKLMRKLLPYMGERRTAKIKEVLSFTKVHCSQAQSLKVMTRDFHGRFAGKAK